MAHLSKGTVTWITALVTILLLAAISPRLFHILTYQPTRTRRDESTLRWQPAYRDPVALHYEGEIVHYPMDGPEADEEFAKLIPSTGHLVHLQNEPEPYTVTLFHQLQCLDVLRRQYGDDYPSTPERTQHCLTYLQQSVLCRPHIGLEVAKNAAANARRSYEMVCNDWEAVYKEAARNWEVYSKKV